MTASSETLPIRSENDIVSVRQAVRAQAVRLKYSLVDQTKIVTAASELARNTLIYGGGGEARLELISEGMRHGLRISFIDCGPGIRDIDEALRDGFTSGKGMGLGLGGARRLVNEFHIESKVGEGTCVVITKWK